MITGINESETQIIHHVSVNASLIVENAVQIKSGITVIVGAIVKI